MGARCESERRRRVHRYSRQPYPRAHSFVLSYATAVVKLPARGKVALTCKRSSVPNSDALIDPLPSVSIIENVSRRDSTVGPLLLGLT